jgi:hypothetical protein
VTAAREGGGHFFGLENPKLFTVICLDFLLRYAGGVEEN